MSLNDIQKDLTSVMSEISKAKSNFSRLEGQELELLRQMKESLGLNSVEEAEKELDKLSKLIAKKTADIESDYKELKDSYDW